MIASPSDLHAAINHAEKIEMARNFAASGQQGQRQGNPNRGRGRFMRGHGKFNAVQAQPVNTGGNVAVVCNLADRPVADLVIGHLIETSVENVIVGDIGHISVPQEVEEDVRK